MITHTDTVFGNYAKEVVVGAASTSFGLHGHLLPLPIANDKLVDWPLECHSSLRPKLIDLINMTVAGINFLNGNCRPTFCAGIGSSAQQSVLSRLVRKWWNVARHLSRKGAEAHHYKGAFKNLVGDSRPSSSSSLQAHKVDMLDVCGNLHLDEFVPSTFNATINTPTSFFYF